MGGLPVGFIAARDVANVHASLEGAAVTAARLTPVVAALAAIRARAGYPAQRVGYFRVIFNSILLP